MNSNHRPLSPHLQIYRPQWTSVLSILHRVSGVLLSVGTVLMVMWLVSLAGGASRYDAMREFMGHPLVTLLLIGWTLALFYHLLNGIRHLLWDTGMLLELGPAQVSGWIVLVLSAILTALAWGGALL